MYLPVTNNKQPIKKPGLYVRKASEGKRKIEKNCMPTKI